MKSSTPDKPDPLGDKVVPEKQATEEWRPIPGKPGFFINTKGQVKYIPPGK